MRHTITRPRQGFIRKHVFSLDHKVIGKQYYGLALVAVFVGMVLSWIMRIHLGWTNAAIPGLQLLSKNGAPGGIMTPEYYLQLMTMHGTIMVFFVLTTAPFAAFGNYLPADSGRRRGHAVPAFQHDVLLGHVRRLPGPDGVVLRAVMDQPSVAGRSMRRSVPWVRLRGPGQGTGVVLWAASIALFCVGQLLGSLNFITTTLDLRVQGHEPDAPAAQRLGVVHHLVHGPHGIRGADARVHPCHPRPRGRHQLLRPVESGHQRPAAAALGRLDASLAAPVLVLRTSRGLHRDRARHGHRLPCSDHQHAQADAQPPGA